MSNNSNSHNNDNNDNNDNNNHNNGNSRTTTTTSSLISNDGSRRGSLYSPSTDGIPKDDAGRVHHLSLRSGDCASRVVSVGDPTRAEALASWFDDDEPTRRYDSHRPGAFTTFTGTYGGVEVSIVSTGMGCANMDFVVRECRAIVPPGPMVMIRFGSCGIIDGSTEPGCVCVSDGSLMVTRNVDAFHADHINNNCCQKDDATTQIQMPKYNFSRPVSSHPDLTSRLCQCLADAIGPDRVRRGMNATADSFYSSQGRISTHFDDGNESLLDEMRTNPHDIVTCEMETYHLLHMARCCSVQHPMAAGAAVIGVASRSTGRVLETSEMRELERAGGRAVLEAIAKFDLDQI